MIPLKIPKIKSVKLYNSSVILQSPIANPNCKKF